MRLLSEIRNYLGNYHVKSGVYHFVRKEYSQAVAFLRKALSDEESLGEGDRKNARDYLTLALKGLGEKLAAEGEIAAGIDELRRATEVDPHFPDIHFHMGVWLERLERRDEAAAAYRQAIECHPGYLEAHVSLGNCLLEADRREEAADVLRRALELKIEQTRRPFEQALAALEAGRLDVAREGFHEAFRAVPRLTQEYLEDALESIRAEEYERALGQLDRALELSPKYPDLHNFRGIALCELDRWDEAAAAFRRSARLCAGHMVPRLNLAFTHLRAGRAEEGEAELRAILDEDPQQPVALARLRELEKACVPDKRGHGARS
jgi:Flp pilus assembly protein TadD